jgi:hypothetical protein
MAPDYLRAVCQPTGIYGDPSACLCTTQNWAILANVSFRQFAAIDRVILAVPVWANLPIGVQLILPTHFRMYAARSWVNLYALPTRFWVYAAHLRVKLYAARSQVNLYATCSQVNLYATCLRVNLYAAHSWVNLYAAHLRVNLYAAHSWVKLYAARLWVNNQTILPACLWVYNSPQFERSYVSVWRDSTAQYNVADHPFFVFHPKPVDCSSFYETFKIYVHHLLQYRFAHVIEFILY